MVGIGALAAPAAADWNQCAPAGLDSATVLPKDLTETPDRGPTTTGTRQPTVEPLSAVNIGALGLGTPGVLTVGTLSDAPPNVCVNPTGEFSGFDNQLLRAIADKLGLQVRFVGTDFSGLLAQVASRRFDVGSSSIKATDARRRTVAFTNGYDFGYYSLVVPPGSAIHKFSDLAAGQRIGVVQGTVEESYVVDTLHLQPVKYPDFATLYASLKTRQIDAWVAPATLASDRDPAGRSGGGRREHLQPRQFRGLCGRQRQPAAGRCAELRVGRRHRRRHLGEAVLPVGAADAAAGLETRVESRPCPEPAGFRRDRREPAPQAGGPGRTEVDAGPVA